MQAGQKTEKITNILICKLCLVVLPIFIQKLHFSALFGRSANIHTKAALFYFESKLLKLIMHSHVCLLFTTEAYVEKGWCDTLDTVITHSSPAHDITDTADGHKMAALTVMFL